MVRVLALLFPVLGRGGDRTARLAVVVGEAEKFEEFGGRSLRAGWLD